jgi:multisubunit Na+/H+ antiporter MnhF subunit
MLSIFVILIIIIICLNICLFCVNKHILTKILLVNSLTTISTLLICFIGTFKYNDFYFDIAIIYLLLSFASSIAYLKYFSSKDS